MSQLHSMLRAMDSISLDATNDQAALLRRFDTKYMAGIEDVIHLLGELSETFRILEIDGLRMFNYRSEYLDSPSREAYRAHLQGRRRRYKCRIRHYVDSAECHVEVKLKGERGETVKSRAPHSDEGRLSECAAFLAACVADAYGLTVDKNLRRVLDVSYRRITLVSRAGAERVTLDNHISFRDVDTNRECALNESVWIIETKSAAGRGAADAVLRRARLRPVDVSKYVLGLTLTDPGVRVRDHASITRDLNNSVKRLGVAAVDTATAPSTNSVPCPRELRRGQGTRIDDPVEQKELAPHTIHAL